MVAKTILIARKLFVTQKLIRTNSFLAISPKSTSHRGKGWGGGGEQRLSRNVAGNKAFQSFVLKRNKTF